MAKKVFGSLELRTQSSILFTDADSSNSVALKAPATVATNLTLTLPASVTANGVLSTDASGNLSAALLTNANVDASAAINYSKLDLAGSIVDADIDAAAAISLSKLAALTTARALVSDGSGVISASAVTATELGYVSGVTSAIQTQLDTKLEASDITGKASTALDNLTVSGLAAESLLVGSSSSAVVSLAVGTEGQVLKVVGGALAFANDTGISSVQADWADSDGATKSITHSLGTKDIIVQIYDKSDDSTIEVDAVVRTDANTLDLTASEAPSASGWRVLIVKAG